MSATTVTAAGVDPAPGQGEPHPPGEVIMRARGLEMSFGRTHALRGVDLDRLSGEVLAVSGPSGSGKSTLLHCLAGLDTPASGHVLIAGRDLAGMNDKQLTAVRRDQLGFVFQAFNLLPTLTAEENILLPTRLAHRTPDPNWQNAVIAALGIGDRLTHRPAELSGGQQQRVAVARALMSRPAVIVADEPTGNLDSHSTTEVMDLLRRAVDELGQSVIMVTHDTSTAAYADRVLVCRDGRIVSDLRDVTADTLTAALR